jgi:hypothetical protein
MSTLIIQASSVVMPGPTAQSHLEPTALYLDFQPHPSLVDIHRRTISSCDFLAAPLCLRFRELKWRMEVPLIGVQVEM